jgi:predicted outer membrane protein
MHLYLRIGIVSLMAGLGLACSGENGPATETGDLPTPANITGEPKDDRDVNGDRNDRNRRLNDAQIATVLHTINVGEIRQARFALRHATREDVREFATQMETEHKEVERKLRALCRDDVELPEPDMDDTASLMPDDDSPPNRDVGGAPSHISRLLQRKARLDIAALRLVESPAFDLGYITVQVAMHGGAGGIMDQQLLPSVRKEELRALMEEVRPAIDEHLATATATTQTIIDEQGKGKGNGPPH